MNTATFDTLSAARSLEAAGIESKQAEAIVGAIRSSGEASVTKADLTAHRLRPRYYCRAACSGGGHSRSSRTVADLCEHLRWPPIKGKS